LLLSVVLSPVSTSLGRDLPWPFKGLKQKFIHTFFVCQE
jgi:hypothetical protein